MKRISGIQSALAVLAVLVLMASSVAFAAPSPHTIANLDGTLHKTSDGKGYVVRVETAKTEDGKDLPDLKGKEVPLPKDMGDDMSACCDKHCDKAVQVKCCIDEKGNIAAVSQVSGRDFSKPGTK